MQPRCDGPERVLYGCTAEGPKHNILHLTINPTPPVRLVVPAGEGRGDRRSPLEPGGLLRHRSRLAVRCNQGGGDLFGGAFIIVVVVAGAAVMVGGLGTMVLPVLITNY